METRHINPFQLARRWGINPKTLQNWRCRGTGPPYLKIGGHILYRLEEIEAYEADRHIATNHSTAYKKEHKA
ncbi:MAG: helix-turn-helix domain-containing protein [Magnetococcales bacterium]|nr:helix-turn-helix domain-containing protein [Magnetococcales bacterium]MBF0628163.1 helix-turn-helix domain-containing protein [Magnetococcales bacterium]